MTAFLSLRPYEHAVKGRPMTLNGTAQDGLYGIVKPVHLRCGELVRRPLWMEAGAEKGFIDIDVAQSGNELLIEQQWLDPAAPPGQEGGKRLAIKGVLKRFRPQVT
jgi:hypothetical protein